MRIAYVPQIIIEKPDAARRMVNGNRCLYITYGKSVEILTRAMKQYAEIVTNTVGAYVWTLLFVILHDSCTLVCH